MALKIRLARAGSKKRPYYHVVVADVRSPRDGRFIEQLGSWNPLLPKDGERVKIDADRVKHWLGHGALPTDRVAALPRRGRHRQARGPQQPDQGPAGQEGAGARRRAEEGAGRRRRRDRRRDRRAGRGSCRFLIFSAGGPNADGGGAIPRRCFVRIIRRPRRAQAALRFGWIRPRSISSSAICTALSAAPLRRLSETIHIDRPLSTVESSRMREMKVASSPAESRGVM